MIKKDISMIALVFFITRCFFNLYTINNIYYFISLFIVIIISICLLRKIKVDLFKFKLFKLFYLFSILMIFIIIISNTVLFINNNFFKYNNFFVITISLIIISYLLGRDKLKTISSISEIFMILFVFVSIIIYIGLFSLIKINNYDNFIRLNNFNINILPLLIVFVFFYIKDNNIITGYIIGTLSVLLDSIFLIGCLGTKIILNYKFPGISILKSLNFFSFINHLDKFFSFIYLFEYTITLALIIHIILNIIKKLKT